MGFDERFDTTIIVIRKDDSNNQLKVTQTAKLGHDGALELPEGGSCIAVFESKRVNEVAMEMRAISGPANIIQHLVPRIEDLRA